MKPPCASSKRFLLGSAALAALTLLTCATSATSAGGLDRQYKGGTARQNLIVPGESIGYAALGMTRKTIQHKLKSPIAPERSQDGQLYFLTYRYPYHSGGLCDTVPGDKLIIGFKGLSRGAHAVYMLTLEPCLVTKPEYIGVGSTLDQLHDAYGVSCYHRDPVDGSRDPDIDDNENSVCERRDNGGFTYFSFASVDADPSRSIGAIAIATRRID